MKKRFLAVFLCVALLVSNMPGQKVYAAADETETEASVSEMTPAEEALISDLGEDDIIYNEAESTEQEGEPVSMEENTGSDSNGSAESGPVAENTDSLSETEELTQSEQESEAQSETTEEEQQNQKTETGETQALSTDSQEAAAGEAETQTEEAGTQELQTEQTQTEETQTEEPQTEETQSGEAQSGEAQTQETQTEETQTQETQTEELQTEELQTEEADSTEKREVETRPIAVTINWSGDIPTNFTYPDAVYVTLERSLDGETWEPYEVGGPFAITPNEANQWIADFAVPAVNEPEGEEEPQAYYYRVTEDPNGLSRFLRSGSVTVLPGASGNVSFTNTYNDAWDYTVDLYWDRSGDERYHVNTQTVLGDGDALVYKLDIRTQKQYDAIPTTVSDDFLLNPTSGLVIRIPLHLLKDRNGNWVDPSGYSISSDANPTIDLEYTYRIIGDEIFFYNYRALPPSYQASYTVGYTVDPENTPDGSTGSLYAYAVGHYVGQPASDDGVQSTSPITYRIDTGSYLTSLAKDDGLSLHYANGSLAGLEMDTDNYVYVWYIVRAKAAGNQPATITLTDTPKYYNEALGEYVVGGDVVKIVKWNWMDEHSTATVGTYPKGTNVPFTINGDGSFSWTTQYDAVTANIPLVYGSYNYWSILRAQAEQDFFVVVRYPKDTYNPTLGYAPNYNNNVTAELEVNDPQHEGDVRPDPENGITGNDFNDTDSKTADAMAEYIPGGWEGWGGSPWAIEKSARDNPYGNGSATSWISGIEVQGAYTVSMIGHGYNLTDEGRGYQLTLWDDDIYVSPRIGTSTYGAWEKLGVGDYQIYAGSQTNVIVTAWQIDRSTGAQVMDTSKLPSGEFKVYGEKADGSWELVTSFTMTAGNSTCSDTQAVRTIPLTSAMLNGKGYIGLKVESPEGLIDYVKITISSFVIRLIGTSPVMEAWRDAHGDNLKGVRLINFSTHRFYSEDENGNYVWSNQQTGPSCTYSGNTTGLAESEKTADGEYELYTYHFTTLQSVNWMATAYKNVLSEQNDTTVRVYRYQWRLSAMQYINIQGAPTATTRSFFADTGVFYDLLPVGYTIDLSRPIFVQGYSGNQTGGNNKLYGALDGDPIIIDNYKNTGRQLVIFKVRTLLASGYNYYQGTGQLGTGFCVDFWTQVAYSDISNSTVTNIFAYQRGDRRNIGFNYPNSRGYGGSQTGFLINGILPLANVELESFDMASTGNTTVYSSKAVLPTFLPSIQAGLYKHVKAESGIWTSEDVTDVDANYAYRMRLSTAGDDEIKYYTGNIVLYDTLENAANTGGATGETDGWKGTLVSVDTSALTRLGAAPVVYYTTKVGISYNDGFSEAWNDSLANNPGIWIRADEFSGDLSTVTAIAVDLRFKADGTTPFIVENEKNLDVIINMHSPGEVPENQYAYNRPAYQAQTWTETTPGTPVDSFEIGARTVLALRDLQDIEFIKFYTVYNTTTGESGQTPLANATFALYQCIDPEGDYLNVGMPGTSAAASCWSTTALATTLSGADGEVSFTGLDSGIYAIRETAVSASPAGIQRLSYRFWVFTVDAVAGTVSEIVGYSTNEASYPPVQMTQGTNGLMLEDPYYTRELTITKVWDDMNNIDDIRPDSVTVQLRRNGSAYGPVVVLNEGNSWTHTWEDLPMYSAYTSATNNTKYTYTVTEVEVPEGYELVVTGTADVGFTFTNKHVPPTGDLQISKAITSGSAETPFTVEITLVKNSVNISGSYTATVTKDEETRTETVTFTNGEATIMIYPGETWLIQDLVAGATYTVSEIDLPHGWTLETAAADLTGTIPVKDPESATPEIAIATLTNSYTPDPVDVVLGVEKVLTGDLEPGKTYTFSFELASEAGAPVAANPVSVQVTLPGEATAAFGAIHFTKTGTFTYTVTETSGSDHGITYYTGEKTVTITITDTDGVLQASVDGAEAVTSGTTTVYQVTIENTYQPDPVDVVLGVEKVLTGDLEPGKSYTFTFELAAGENSPEAASPTSIEVTLPTGPATADFGAIHFTKAGTYTYTITETDGGVHGVTYDTAPKTVTITVTDVNGVLQAAVEGATQTGSGENIVYRVEVENTYTPDPVDVVLGVEKVLTGDLEPGKTYTFTFNLAAGENSPAAASPTSVEVTLPTGPATADFGAIHFTKAGTYTYTVTETDGGVHGVTYDTAPKTVTIVVTDVDGVLQAAVEGATQTGSGENIVYRVEVENTYTPDPVDVVLGVEKILTGDLEPGATYTFTFNLAANDGSPEAANPTQVEVTLPTGPATADFGAIHFTKAGTYTYTVTETDDGVHGVTYDTEPKTVTITVTDTDGVLSAAVEGAAQTGSGENIVYRVTVTNDYMPNPVDVVLGVEKVLTGDLEPGKTYTFTFNLAAGENSPEAASPTSVDVTLPTGPATADFGAIRFTKAGTYTYTITETDGRVHGVTYDTAPKTITITVTDTNGVLSAAVEGAVQTGSGENIVYRVTVTNTYVPDPVDVVLGVEKVLTGDLEPGKTYTFTFNLTAGENSPEAASPTSIEVTLPGNATADFGAIHFTKAGTYTYTVTETDGGVHGVTYDTEPKMVTITVTDTDGVLSATIEGAEADESGATTVYRVEIENTYVPDPVDVVLGVEKVLTGDLEPGKTYTFTFELAADGESPAAADPTSIEITLPGEDATADFGLIHFTKAGTYTYTVTETDGGVHGVTYDTEPKTVTIIVTDTNGVLSAAVEGAEADESGATIVYRVTVENDYMPDPVDVTLGVEKVLTGDLEPEKTYTFTFELAAEGESPAPADPTSIEITLPGDTATAEFGAIHFTKAGVYTYTITETEGDDHGMSYDTESKTVTITVTDVDGVLQAVVESAEADENETEEGTRIIYRVTVENTYVADPVELILPITKILEGEPDVDLEFTFTLSAKGEEPMPEEDTVTIVGAGEGSFGPITFTKTGTYTYTVKETEGDFPGMTYDTAVRTIVVTVTDESGVLKTSWTVNDETVDSVEFTNVYKPVLTEIPVTKVWDDNHDQDGSRPKSVTIHLLADGVDTGKTLVLTEEVEWKGTFTELPVYSKGVEIVYTIEEDAVEKYTTAITGDQNEGFTVTNSHTPPHTPHTGDNAQTGLLALLMGASLVGLMVTAVVAKRRKEEDME